MPTENSSLETKRQEMKENVFRAGWFWSQSGYNDGLYNERQIWIPDRPELARIYVNAYVDGMLHRSRQYPPSEF